MNLKRSDFTEDQNECISMTCCDCGHTDDPGAGWECEDCGGDMVSDLTYESSCRLCGRTHEEDDIVYEQIEGDDTLCDRCFSNLEA